MKKPNITPGEWHVSSGDEIWAEDGESKIAEICELPKIYVAGKMRSNDEQETANARFIAAAPKMAEALEICFLDLEGIPDDALTIKVKAALVAAGYEF